MAKYPQPGLVKTRLAQDIGTVAAAWWYRHQLTRLLRRLSGDPRWTTTLALAPDGASGRRMPGLPPGVAIIPQGPGTLAQRMLRVFTRTGGQRVVLIGSDIPGIRRRHIALAFRALGATEMVFGPAADGGFWLAGVRRGGNPVPAGLFNSVRMSTEHALADTLSGLAGRSIALLPELSDIDTSADLARCDPAALALPQRRGYPLTKGPNRRRT